MVRTQCEALAQTNDDTASNKATDIAFWRESLHEGGNDDEQRSSCHTRATASEVGKRATHEKPCNNGTDGVGGVDGALSLRVLFCIHVSG